MLLLALSLTLSSVHLPPASSLHLLEAQVEAPSRLVQIEQELATVRTTLTPGSVVLMAVGFGGTVTFALAGLLLGVAVGGLPGVLILVVGLAVGALSLTLGISGFIWGEVQLGRDRDRLTRLTEERALLREALSPPPLVTLATF